MSRYPAAAVLVVTLALWATPVWAHDAAPPGTYLVTPRVDPAPLTDISPWSNTIIANGSPQTAELWVLLLLAHAAVLAAFAKSRRALVGLLIVMLLVFSVEATVHSVHHLGDGERASNCEFATIAGQLSVVPADVVVFDHVLAPAAGERSPDPEIPPRSVAYPPSRGRAPPARPSV